MKTIIAFATKGGVTAESAHVIAEVLEKQFGYEVDSVNFFILNRLVLHLQVPLRHALLEWCLG